MTRPLRGAIVGFGAVAEHGHLRGWLADPRFTIVAVVDPHPERRRRAADFLPSARVYSHFEELLTTESLDFVDVASPPAHHRDVIAAAAQRGLHVLCEKPLVTSAQAYAHVHAAVSTGGGVLHPVHNWKHAEGFHAMTRLGERIGALREMSFRVERNGWSVSVGDWRAERSLGGGGILVDHGWHTFYLALAWARSMPRRVSATIARHRYLDVDVEDTAHCEIEFDTCRAVIDLTWAGRDRRTEWALLGTRAHATIHDDELRIDDGDAVTQRRLDASLSAGSHHPEWFPGVIESFAAEIAEPARRGVGQREAETCLAILEAAYASAADGGMPQDMEQVSR